MSTSMVRPAVRNDLPGILELETLSFSDPWSSTSLRESLDHADTLTLVAEVPEGDLPLGGYLMLRLIEPEAELLRIAVHPSLRQRKLGSSMLARALTELSSRQVVLCYLEARPDNLAAVRLYQSFSASPVARRPAYYRDGTDALVYCLQVRPDSENHRS